MRKFHLHRNDFIDPLSSSERVNFLSILFQWTMLHFDLIHYRWLKQPLCKYLQNFQYLWKLYKIVCIFYAIRYKMPKSLFFSSPPNFSHEFCSVFLCPRVSKLWSPKSRVSKVFPHFSVGTLKYFQKNFKLIFCP